MKLNVFYLFLLLGLMPLQGKTQIRENPMIIAQFEHQTDNPVAFPNYFDDHQFTDSLMSFLENWLRKNYKVTVMDYKKVNPISFVPGIKPLSEPKSILETAYNYSVGIVSVLESGLASDKYKPEEGVLKFDFWIQDRKGRKVYRNKIALRFVISEKPSNPGEIFLGREDFYTLYRDGIAELLHVNAAKKMYVFQKPENELFTDLILMSKPQQLTRVDRGTFEIKGGENFLACRLDLDSPFQEADFYSRTAIFFNPFDQKSYVIEASLKKGQAHRIFNEVRIGTVSQSAGQSLQTLEKYLLEQNIWGDFWKLSRNLYSKSFGVYKNSHLMALFLYQGGDPDFDAQYTFYLNPQCNDAEKITTFNLIAVEALSLTLQKYYELETHRKQK